jgi:hypothetical protein
MDSKNLQIVTLTVGKASHGECHCMCHYLPETRHIVACCDQCYKQYDRAIMNESARLHALYYVKDALERELKEPMKSAYVSERIIKSCHESIERLS